MDTEKRYWLFIFDEYYPAGGMRDFKCSYDSCEEALAEFSKLKKPTSSLFGQVFDSVNKCIIEEPTNERV